MPDIILISVDSLRPDHLGCYGYQRNTSPTIDALAGKGVRCANAVSTTSWTLPAHAALFTGLYDSAHGLVDNGLRMVEAHVTLAEVLLEAGYQTAGFFGGPYLHPTFGFGQGFLTYQSCMTTISDDATDGTIRRDSKRSASASHADITGPRTLVKLNARLSMLDDRPLFLFLHLWDVHYDYIPPEPYARMFDPDYRGTITAENFVLNQAIRPGMPDRDLKHIVALYDGEIRFTDDILGKILDSLDRSGRLEQALVVVTADHGEEFFEHQGKGHNRTLYDEVIRIPLIFRWPGHLPQSAVIEQQVRLIDVMPTILSLVGISLGTEVQGQDLSGLLRGEESSDRPAFCELLLDGRRLRSLRTAQNKVVTYAGAQQRAIFDLATDPKEQRPLFEMSPQFEQGLAEIAQTLKACDAIRQRVVRAESQAVEIDSELTGHLRSLGYLGGQDSEEDQTDEDE